MTKEAMKPALEALEDFSDVIKYDNENDDIGYRACCHVLSYDSHSKNCKATKAITALQEALAEPQQEPVAWPIDGDTARRIADKVCVSYETVQQVARELVAMQPAQPQQEPACYKHGDELKQGCAWCDKQPAQPQELARIPVLIKRIEHEKAQAQKYFELYNQVCETAQLRLKEIARLDARLAEEQQQKPVGVVAPDPDRVDWLRDEPEVGALLYTSPPASKPLTDERIFELASEHQDWDRNLIRVRSFARAIEAAHQIGVEK